MGIDFTIIRFTGYCIPLRELDDVTIELYKHVSKVNRRIFIHTQDMYEPINEDACLALGRIRHLEVMNTMAIGWERDGLYGGGKQPACIPLTDYHAAENYAFNKEIKSLEKHIVVPREFRKYFREWLFTFFH
jgi:hypothetical protein